MTGHISACALASLLLIGVVVKGQAATTVTMSFEVSENANVGDGVTIVAIIEGNLNLQFQLFKSQDSSTEEKPIHAKDSDTVFLPPFEVNKYSFTSERVADQKAVWKFTIKAAAVEDSGIYYAKLSDKYDSKFTELSNKIELKVLNDPVTNHVEFTSNATVENQLYSFETPASVICKASADTNAMGLTLKIFENENDVTPSFALEDASLSWRGDTVGLQTPVMTVALTNPGYTPQVGQRTMKCILRFKDSDIGEKDFETLRTAEPKLNCTSRFSKIKTDDENVRIICTVSDYDGPLNETTSNWQFYHQQKLQSLNTEDNNYDRETFIKNQALILRIPKVTTDMISNQGTVVTYNITLTKDGTPVANSTFSLRVDTTVKVTDNASKKNLVNVLLILSATIFSLIR